MLTISHASVYPGKACSLLVYQPLKLIIHVFGLYSAHLVVEVFEVNFQRSSWYGTWVRYSIASHVDVLRGSSRVPAPLTSAEPKNTFLSYCSQISTGDHMQIIGDPISAVEVNVLTSQTHTYKLGRV